MSNRVAVRRAVTLAFAAVGLVLSSDALVFAQEATPAPLNLEQTLNVEIPTVVGASRFAQRVVDAPATVTIVTSDEIARFGYRSFADVLRGVRGFYVNYDRNYSYVGARGFLRPGDYNSRVLLLVDGHRLNDNIFDSATIGTEFPIDLDLIDRVEVVRGPSSSLYGTSAFFAVVNVVTRRGSTGHSEVALAGGSQSTVDGRVTLARELPHDSDLLLSVSGYGSDGEARVGNGAGGSSVGLDHDRATRLFGSYSKGRWNAQGVYATRTKGIPTGAYGTSLADPASETTDGRGFVDLRYDGALRGTSVLWSGTYDWYAYDGVYALDGGTQQADFAHGQSWASELTGSRRMEKHLVTAGGEVRDNLQQDQGGFFLGAGGGRNWFVDIRRQSWQSALYAQDEFKLSRGVIVSAGIRSDFWPSFGSTTNPRLGLILKPRPNASFKVLHGTAFRAPNLYELYYYGDFSATLRPEQIRTTEVAWEQHVAGPTRVTVSGFHYRIRDLISQVALDGAVNDIGFANLGVSTAWGAEGELERTWGPAQVLGSYTFSATRSGSDTPLSNSPRHLALARVTTPLVGRAGTVGMEWLYTSERRTISGERTAGFALGNLTLASGQLRGRTRLSLDIHNLLDRGYADPGGEEHLGPIVQDGRTVRARITWRY